MDTVYIGRPSKWGNPYKVERFGREMAIIKYEDYLFRSELIKEIHELKCKILLCHCFPYPCHGDVLLKYLYA